MNGKLSRKARKITLKVLKSRPDIGIEAVRMASGQIVNPKRILYQRIKRELK